MKKASWLYRTFGEKGKCYDFSSDAIVWDCSWSMQATPYPPEPSYEFIVKHKGEIMKILPIWVGYFDALFHYMKEADLLDSDLGNMLVTFCWLGDTDDDWVLDQKDINDFTSILKVTPLYELSSKQKEILQIFLPEVQELEALRNYLIGFFTTALAKGYSIYFHKS